LFVRVAEILGELSANWKLARNGFEEISGDVGEVDFWLGIRLGSSSGRKPESPPAQGSFKTDDTTPKTAATTRGLALSIQGGTHGRL
jgi:hypothetical protein